jgi:hypothetical protein
LQQQQPLCSHTVRALLLVQDQEQLLLSLALVCVVVIERVTFKLMVDWLAPYRYTRNSTNAWHRRCSTFAA